MHRVRPGQHTPLAALGSPTPRALSGVGVAQTVDGPMDRDMQTGLHFGEAHRKRAASASKSERREAVELLRVTGLTLTSRTLTSR